MAAFTTKGQKAYLLKGSSTPSLLTPTAITKAAPAVVTVASTTGMSVGDLVVIPATGITGQTGFAELDGKTWVVGSVPNGTTFTLLGSDTSASTGTLAGSPSVSTYANATKMVLCDFSDLTLNPDAASQNSVATFEDPTATVSSQVVGAGSVDISGYVNISDAGYKELDLARNDAVSRKMVVKLANSQGYLVLDGIVAALTPSMPIDGAIGFKGTMNLITKFRHLF
jgi:membrane peptidoglycan carboxypeptidase